MRPNKGLRTLVRDSLATYGASWLWLVFLLSAFSAFLSSIGFDMTTNSHIGVMITWLSRIPETSILLTQSKGLAVFMTLIFAPFAEEAFFRYFLLTWARHHSARMVRATLIVGCGMLFGILHGSPLNLFLQGVLGVFFGLLYLRNADYPVKAYLSCVFVHSMYNFSVLMMAN